jgi:hypothetical protein
MNKIVKRHLPVAELPMTWRAELPGEALVRVEIQVEKKPRGTVRISELVGSGENVHGIEEEVIEHIARLRDADA